MATKFKFDSEKLKSMFSDVGEKAKAARETVESRRDELAQFNKSNVEALKASGKILVDGAKPIATDVVANTRRQLGETAETVKSFKGKKPAEMIKLQREASKVQMASVKAETKAFGEAVAKLVGEVVEPIKDRVAVVTKREPVAA
ncbi:MAG: phasin family protein [Novosphingobium sp.]